MQEMQGQDMATQSRRGYHPCETVQSTECEIQPLNCMECAAELTDRDLINV